MQRSRHRAPVAPDSAGSATSRFRRKPQADAPHGGSQGVDGGGIRATLFAMQPFLLFSLPFMLLDQGGAGREYGRESEKQSADSGTPFPGDQAGNNSCDAAGDETQSVFMPLRLFQSRGVDFDSSLSVAYFKKIRHNPKAVRNQNGIAESVAVRADSRNLARSWLTRILYRQSPAAPAIIERHSVPGKSLTVFRNRECEGCESDRRRGAE